MLLPANLSTIRNSRPNSAAEREAKMKNIISHISNIIKASIKLKEKEIPSFMDEIFEIADFTKNMTEAYHASNRRTKNCIEKTNQKVKYEYYGPESEWHVFDEEFYDCNHNTIAEVRIYDKDEDHVYHIEIANLPANEIEEYDTQFLVKKKLIKSEVEYIVIINYALNPSGELVAIPQSCILKLTDWAIRNNKIDQCRFRNIDSIAQ